MAQLAAPYLPRRPTETVLYRLVRRHLETFLEHARETYNAPLPAYVEQEFRAYLRCGVFAHGFVHARCEKCGHDLLVAFSCKGRGACPSCAGRRMANTAAHMVDRVLPAVPVRQWVLSLPFELRAIAAFRADVLTALSRIFVESVFMRYRADARRLGLAPAECGAVTFVQRFGSSLNLHVHFHVVVLDGVFTRDSHDDLHFHPAEPPDREELITIAKRVHRRVAAWLARRERVIAEAVEPSAPLSACAATAMQRGTTRTLPHVEDEDAAHTAGDEPSMPVRDAVDHVGFNLEASVRITADDDLGRERLCRYGARPPFSIGRLRMIPGGRVAYRVKKVGRGRAKTRIMTPLEFLARLSALIPPPRYPLIRYHGALAPRSSWRRYVVPKAPERDRDPRCVRPPSEAIPKAPDGASRSSPPRVAPSSSSGARRETNPEKPGEPLPDAIKPADPDIPTVASPLRSGNAPNVITVAHWNRLLSGALLAASPRIDWATLLRRTFDTDVLQCPRCHGRIHILADVTDPAIARAILQTLGVDSEAPLTARARDPTELLGDVDAGD